MGQNTQLHVYKHLAYLHFLKLSKNSQAKKILKQTILT